MLATACSWRGRVTDYEMFCSEELRGDIQDTGVQVTGYRTLRDLMCAIQN